MGEGRVGVSKRPLEFFHSFPRAKGGEIYFLRDHQN